MHRPNRLLYSIAWYVGKFKLLTGIASLGAAGAILAISGRRRANGNSDAALRLVPLMLAAFSLFFLTSREQRPTDRHQ